MKYERVQEEVERGFNIITNGELPTGLSKLESTKFMKPKVAVWDKLSSPQAGAKEKATETVVGQVAPAIEISGCDF